LTNIKIYSCNTYVTYVKCLISQNPKIAHFFLPSIIGFISPSSIMLEPIISAPALPKTIDRRAPILMIALLMMVVSYCASKSIYYFEADSGSFAIFINFCIIPSIGITNSSSMSVENRCNSKVRIMQMKHVFPIEKSASFLLYELLSMIAMIESVFSPFTKLLFTPLYVKLVLIFNIALELAV
jgi:hypothetical protein